MEKREDIKEAMTSYANRLREVRKLSAPSVEEVENAEDYSRLLLHNFRRIGELAGENAEVLDKILMPMLKGNEQLDEETAAQLDELNRLLLDERHEDVVDSCLAEMINNRLNDKAEEVPGEESDDDTDKIVRMLERTIDMDYEHIARTYRGGAKEEAKKVVEKSENDYEEVLGFLEKERFLELSQHSRERVIVVSCFGACIFEPVDAMRMINQLKGLKARFKDPFYRNALPDFDWDGHEFLISEYIAETSYCDVTEDVCKEAFKAACECEEMIKQGRAGEYAERFGEEHIKTLLMLTAVAVMDPSLDRRLSDTIECYERRDKEDYSRAGTNANIATASLIFRMINILREKRGGKVSERLLDLQRRIPYEIMSYYSLARSAEMTMSFGMHLNNFLEEFREIPGGVCFSELSMRALVAIHPPTYVHSNMVARISICIGRHMIAKQPERFIGFPGCKSIEDVNAARDRILEYIYHAALYHDVGKLTIMDTIAMYGRRLLDTEFLMLKQHPNNGAELAERFDSIREYADVIRGHHLWYDGSAGYPMDFKVSESPYKTVIDIVLVADCMDAATDRVGRSYSRGKTPEEFAKEVSDGAGTRYSPYVAELLNDPGTKEDISYLLSEGRSRIYRETFGLLTELLQRGQKK